jgi:hypothetical protein
MGGALPGTEYLDVETWTRDAAGPEAVAAGIAADLSYTKGELADLGLAESVGFAALRGDRLVTADLGTKKSLGFA